MNVNFPPEKIQQFKNFAIVGGCGIFGLFLLSMIFDNSGTQGNVSILEKPETTTAQTSTPQDPSHSTPSHASKLEEVSATRESMWKEVGTQCAALELESNEVEAELRMARAQKWLAEAQAQSSKTGIDNVEFLTNQLTLYGAELQKINKKGLEQIDISAKSVAEYRKNTSVVLDLGKAITLYGYQTTPRPTVTFGNLKEQIDACNTAIQRFLAIQKEEWHVIQESNLSAPAINGGAKATGEEGDDNNDE